MKQVLKMWVVAFLLVVIGSWGAVAADAAAAKSISLASARAQIGKAVANPAQLTALTRQLTAADQKAFVASVNEAISKLPGSNDERAAKFLVANRAMLKGSQKGNLRALLAETYATVPPEALTTISEHFSQELFNRALDPSVTYTDEQFASIAKDSVNTIAARVASEDGAAARTALAMAMFVRASNGTPKDLTETLVASLPKGMDASVKEWANSAASEKPSYDEMMGASDAGAIPNPDVVIRIAGTQILEAMLSDLFPVQANPATGYMTTPFLTEVYHTAILAVDQELDSGANGTVFHPPNGGKDEGDEPGPGPIPPYWKQHQTTH